MKLSHDYYSYYNIILWKKNGIIRHYAMYFLSFEFLDEDFDYVLFLRFDFPHAFDHLNIKELIVSMEIIYEDSPKAFVIITHRKELPLFMESPDEFIYSFSADFHLFKEVIDSYSKGGFLNKYLLFELLDQIFEENSNFNKILIRQIPIEPVQIQALTTCDVIIPHRGDNGYLDKLLFFLDQLKELNLYVGIDQEITQDIWSLKNDYAQTSFYHFKPNPVGPYVIRNRLIEQSKSDLLFFQDSDDIPCADRFERIADYMVRHECQLCGSHEVKLDYFDKTVRAIRYPKNVMAALDKGPGQSLLHPSSAITRTAFYLCERLSEERIFGNDTKFLLHSYFLLNKIQNIDEFLYIRRVRPGSLTTSPATKVGSPIRYNLLYRWATDFKLIKSGQLKLENSSLNFEATRLKFEIEKLGDI